jgi:hypothetical protein
VAQVVECLPSKCEALSLTNQSISKIKKNTTYFIQYKALYKELLLFRPRSSWIIMKLCPNCILQADTWCGAHLSQEERPVVGRTWDPQPGSHIPCNMMSHTISAISDPRCLWNHIVHFCGTYISVARSAYFPLTNVWTSTHSLMRQCRLKRSRTLRRIFVNTYLPLTPFWSWFQSKFWWTDVYLLKF